MASKKPQSRREQEQARERTILQATLTELALFDYGGLNFEDVARRAGVNKTTVYRKWSTKAELVGAALRLVFERFQLGPSAGDLRSDLRRVARQLVEFIQSSEGKSLLRLRMVQQQEPELAEIAKQLRAAKSAELYAIADRAVVRGELAEGIDIKLVLDMLWGVLLVKLLLNKEPVTTATIESFLDLVLRAAAPAATSSRPARKRAVRRGVARGR